MMIAIPRWINMIGPGLVTAVPKTGSTPVRRPIRRKTASLCRKNALVPGQSASQVTCRGEAPRRIGLRRGVL